MTMCTCIILIVNLPTELGVNGPVHVLIKVMDQFMGKEDKQVKQHYYVTSYQKLY